MYLNSVRLLKSKHYTVIAFLGGFYTDDIGYVATSCKKCPNGSFVAFDRAPGTSKQDCKSCPEGSNNAAFITSEPEVFHHF